MFRLSLSPNFIPSLLFFLLVSVPCLCSSSLSIIHPREKSLVKRPNGRIIAKEDQPFCHGRYGSPDATQCRFAVARVHVDHASPGRTRNWEMEHLLPVTDTSSVRLPKAYSVKQCIVRIDLREFLVSDLATWAAVKAEIQNVQDKCVKEKGLGGMATAGQAQNIWVSIYNKGSYIDALQRRAHQHGMIAGTLAAHGDQSILDDCKRIDTNANRDEAPGLGPGSLYDYELPSDFTQKEGYNAYCLKDKDCACGYCKPVDVGKKNLLLGFMSTVGLAVGACQSDSAFEMEI